VRNGFVVRAERAIGRQRHPGVGQFRGGEARFSLVHLDVVGEPEGSRITQRSIRARKIEVTGAAQGHVHFAHGREWHAYQEVELVPGRLDECLDLHVVRNVVSGRAAGQRADQSRRQRHRRALHHVSQHARRHFRSPLALTAT
jgi:hypothetical protein